MSFNTNMTADDLVKAADDQRRYDLAQARMWRDHYQVLVDKLERDTKEPTNE